MSLHLRVPKKIGQQVILELRKLDLQDASYQIQRDELFIYVPIRENPPGDAQFSGECEPMDMEPVISAQKAMPTVAGGAFDLIGEIAITKIRNRDRASALAEALVEQRPNIRAVYLDRGIVGEYRLRDLELLSGEPLLYTRYRENGITFELDVSKVYFSPRLATERMLVSNDVRDGEYIIDMFAGIGAFSINIAKSKKARITAIDSNPDAIAFMRRCISINTLQGKIEPVNGDAREVLKNLSPADRIIMNLPHDSSLYLESALSRLKPGGILHYYEILDMESLEQRMEQFRSLGLEILKKREVHGYSASLSMYSLSARYSQE